MRIKSLHLLGWIALAAATLHGQSTTPVYWSTNPAMDCNANNLQEVSFTIPSGATVYSCYVSGTFVWLAAGGSWGTSIRVAAPASGALGVDYTFYDPTANNLSLDTTFGNGSAPTSGNDVNFALFANQPAQLDLLGATSDAPNHGSTATGSVFAQFYCPNAITCLSALPQLIYSETDPKFPWALSVPISWDGSQWSQWSAEGIDDGGSHRVSLVIYNQGTVASIYTVRVYDGNGALAGIGTTAAVAGFGTYGDLLSNIVKTALPSGIFKILIDGGANLSSVAVLQISGQSATTLQVAYDSAPSTSAIATSALRSNVKRAPSIPKRVFNGLPK